MITKCEQEPSEFQYFADPDVRAMIAETGFRVADYVAQEDIGSIVLIDKAARNLYIPIREAQKQTTPDQKTGIYFLNPAGFLSPEVHDVADYAKRRLNTVSEVVGLDSAVAFRIAGDDPDIKRTFFAHGALDMLDDKDRGGRMDVASRFTPLFAKAVKRDSTFNGRVLVLDACRHAGGSQNGITNALKDVGVIDVRSGVVNSISNESVEEPDYVVFDGDEIEDRCRPFGIQEGLLKGGNDMVVEVSEEGLSTLSRLARKELYRIMADGLQNREQFTDFAERLRSRQALNSDPIARMILRDIFGVDADSVDIIEFGDGGVIIQYGEEIQE